MKIERPKHIKHPKALLMGALEDSTVGAGIMYMAFHGAISMRMFVFTNRVVSNGS